MTPIVRRALRVPGRLVWAPTDLTTAYPMGGTEIGFLKKHAVELREPKVEISAEEWGAEVVEVVSGGERVSFVATLADYDEDALAQVFLNSSVGSVTGRRIIGGSTNRAGYLYGSRSGVLAFVPESVISGNDDVDRMVIFHNAIPMVEAQAKLDKQLDLVDQVPVVFVATRTALKPSYEMGFRADLSL